MSFQFRPAARDLAKLLIGMCGASGSGKTFSALRLATGLGGKICVIDTEGGRANMYANDFDFLHCDFTKPFSADRYAQALDAAAKQKPGVIILDSVSHVWEGPGGTLEFAEKERERVKNDFAMWAKPKQAHQKFVNALLQMPCHVILCFRGKVKKEMVPDPDRPGKKIVVEKGWHPIADHSMTYELTLNMLLSTERKGIPIIDGFDFGKLPEPMAHLIKPNELISEQTGKELAAWCAGKGGASKPPAEASPPPSDDDEPIIYEIIVQHGETMEASGIEQAGKMIAGAIGRKDVDYDAANEILKNNMVAIQDMPPAWQDKLNSQVSLKQGAG